MGRALNCFLKLMQYSTVWYWDQEETTPCSVTMQISPSSIARRHWEKWYLQHSIQQEASEMSSTITAEYSLQSATAKNWNCERKFLEHISKVLACPILLHLTTQTHIDFQSLHQDVASHGHTVIVSCLMNRVSLQHSELWSHWQSFKPAGTEDDKHPDKMYQEQKEAICPSLEQDWSWQERLGLTDVLMYHSPFLLHFTWIRGRLSNCSLNSVINTVWY